MKKWLLILLLVSVVSNLDPSGLARPLASRSSSPFEVGTDGCMSRRSLESLDFSSSSASTVESEAEPLSPGFFRSLEGSDIIASEIAPKPVAKAVTFCAPTHIYERRSHSDIVSLGLLNINKKTKIVTPVEPLVKGTCPLNTAKTVIEFRGKTVAVLLRRYGWQVEEIYIISGDEALAGGNKGKPLSQFSSISDIIAFSRTKSGELRGYIRITIAPRLEI